MYNILNLINFTSKMFTYVVKVIKKYIIDVIIDSVVMEFEKNTSLIFVENLKFKYSVDIKKIFFSIKKKRGII